MHVEWVLCRKRGCRSRWKTKISCISYEKARETGSRTAAVARWGLLGAYLGAFLCMYTYIIYISRAHVCTNIISLSIWPCSRRWQAWYTVSVCASTFGDTATVKWTTRTTCRQTLYQSKYQPSPVEYLSLCVCLSICSLRLGISGIWSWNSILRRHHKYMSWDIRWAAP